MTALTPPPRDAHGRLLPGRSGNPGGRPKGIEAVRELLRPHAPAFVAALVDLLQSKDEGTRIAAIREYLDRLVGKAVTLSETDATVRTLDIQALYLQAVQAAQPAPPTIDVTPSPDAVAEIATDQADDAW
jgi:hypothetical protein